MTCSFWPKYIKGRRPGDDHIFQEVGSGMYEEHYTPKHGDVIVDAGAHIGFYTCRVAHRIGTTGKVLAFEPEPENLSVLAEHAIVCGWKNVRIHPIALWSCKDQLQLHLSGSSAEHSLVSHQDHATAVPVAAYPLTSMWDTQLGNLTFMKIDVERAEYAVLVGALPLIERYRPKLVLEIDTEENLDAIKDLLNQRRYGLVPGTTKREFPFIWHGVPL